MRIVITFYMVYVIYKVNIVTSHKILYSCIKPIFNRLLQRILLVL